MKSKPNSAKATAPGPRCGTCRYLATGCICLRVQVRGRFVKMLPAQAGCCLWAAR